VELPLGASLEALLAKSDSDGGTSDEPVEWEEVGENRQPAITPRWAPFITVSSDVNCHGHGCVQ
jgi:hypothetical protein